MHLLERELVVVLAGVGTGVLGAILGTGGGVFLIPVLVLGLGVPMHHAVATSLLSVVATSSAVASTNVERGLANMRLGMVLETATAMGAIAGGLSAGRLSPQVLMSIFAVVLLPVACLMWRGRAGDLEQPGGEGSEPSIRTTAATEWLVAPEEPVGALGSRYRDEAEGRVVAYRVERLWAGMLVALVAGNLSGLLGIGGGVFKVPALHLLCGVPMKAAAATSNFMIGVTAAASAFLYYGRGEVQPVLTATAVFGVLAGSAMGSSLNRHVHGDAARRLFAVLLVAVAAQMMYRARTEKG